MNHTFRHSKQVDYRLSRSLPLLPEGTIEAYELDINVFDLPKYSYVWTLSEAEKWYEGLSIRNKFYARYRRVAVGVFPDGVRRVNFHRLPLDLPLEGEKARKVNGDTNEIP